MTVSQDTVFLRRVISTWVLWQKSQDIISDTWHFIIRTLEQQETAFIKISMESCVHMATMQSPLVIKMKKKHVKQTAEKMGLTLNAVNISFFSTKK